MPLACLSIALLLPFVMREFDLEPYPAVLFPVGARKIDLKEQILRSAKLELFSLDSDGHEHRLPPGKFLHPIPTQYMSSLASPSKKFGLDTEKDVRQTSFGSWQLTANFSRASTIQEKREVIRWLTARLHAVGRPLDRTIVVRNTVVRIDTATGDEIDSEISFQYEIHLDDYNS